MIFLFGLFCFFGGLAALPLYANRDDFLSLSLCLVTFAGLAIMLVSPVYYALSWVISWLM